MLEIPECDFDMEMSPEEIILESSPEKRVRLEAYLQHVYKAANESRWRWLKSYILFFLLALVAAGFISEQIFFNPGDETSYLLLYALPFIPFVFFAVFIYYYAKWEKSGRMIQGYETLENNLKEVECPEKLLALYYLAEVGLLGNKHPGHDFSKMLAKINSYDNSSTQYVFKAGSDFPAS